MALLRQAHEAYPDDAGLIVLLSKAQQYGGAASTKPTRR